MMMRTHLLVVALLLAVVAMAAAQTRPKLSETFEMAGVVLLKYNASYYWGEGTVDSRFLPSPPTPPPHLGSVFDVHTSGLFAVDHAAKKGVERLIFGGFSQLDVLELARYDLVRPPVSLTAPMIMMVDVDMMVTILHSKSCTPWRTGRSAR
jgi:hypothetical protein